MSTRPLIALAKWDWPLSVRRGAGALLLAMLALPASAHDTWLSVHSSPAPQLLALSLSTGKQFPLQESGHELTAVARSGCVDATGRALPLRPRESTTSALLLRVRVAAAGDSAMSCWVSMRPQKAELSPEAVDEYFKEIQAPATARATWDALRRQGVPWRETYIKHARIEFVPGAATKPADLRRMRQPVGQGLEILATGPAAARVGQPLTVDVLDDGKPLTSQPVQLISERLPIGVWRITDEQGQVTFPLPFGGRWMLRLTRLVPPSTPKDEWVGKFSTLVVEPL